ncbi:hypothetical protein EYF80_044035 [Liparis tanakae]|uniref:Uncharacterized protein n=1 Tax=Liparis tanakae TaxID=230148 RepID=A0A4Z2FZH5_9TELE|nr:hypothetical protein EYF80_044035 [Liparis tanakae]
MSESRSDGAAEGREHTFPPEALITAGQSTIKMERSNVTTPGHNVTSALGLRNVSVNGEIPFRDSVPAKPKVCGRPLESRPKPSAEVQLCDPELNLGAFHDSLKVAPRNSDMLTIKQNTV